MMDFLKSFLTGDKAAQKERDVIVLDGASEAPKKTGCGCGGKCACGGTGNCAGGGGCGGKGCGSK